MFVLRFVTVVADTTPISRFFHEEPLFYALSPFSPDAIKTRACHVSHHVCLPCPVFIVTDNRRPR